MDQVKGLGRAMLAAVLLMVGGVLNIIYGIAAIGNSSFFVHNTKYVFSDLKRLGLDHANPWDLGAARVALVVRRWRIDFVADCRFEPMARRMVAP